MWLLLVPSGGRAKRRGEKRRERKWYAHIGLAIAAKELGRTRQTPSSISGCCTHACIWAVSKSAREERIETARCAFSSLTCLSKEGRGRRELARTQRGEVGGGESARRRCRKRKLRCGRTVRSPQIFVLFPHEVSEDGEEGEGKRKGLGLGSTGLAPCLFLSPLLVRKVLGEQHPFPALLRTFSQSHGVWCSKRSTVAAPEVATQGKGISR